MSSYGRQYCYVDQSSNPNVYLSDLKVRVVRSFLGGGVRVSSWSTLVPEIRGHFYLERVTSGIPLGTEDGNGHHWSSKMELVDPTLVVSGSLFRFESGDLSSLFVGKRFDLQFSVTSLTWRWQGEGRFSHHLLTILFSKFILGLIGWKLVFSERYDSIGELTLLFYLSTVMTLLWVQS